MGLSRHQLTFRQTPCGPLPTPAGSGQPDPDPLVYQTCPGKGLNYPRLNLSVFGREADHPLIGCYESLSVGYAADPEIRRRGASGGVITQCLLHLLERDLADGVVALKNGHPRPWIASPVIATTSTEVLTTCQSVYVPAPVNTILDQMAHFEGRLAFVGLPDQVASIRELQRLGHTDACKIKFILGPYTGTAMYLGAVQSFLRSHGIRQLNEIKTLRYREGEWPGYLEITLKSGRVIRAKKFYYNYLIPFFITRSTLYATDFTNELTDISVGDAWHPDYENRGGGFSVVTARTAAGQTLLDAMQADGRLILDPLTLDKALSMHGHMLDFKKRGAFIRMQWRSRLGRPVPDWGYGVPDISFGRKCVECVIYGAILICSTRMARFVVDRIPVQWIGPLFDFLRKTWKRLSKSTKRKGLHEIRLQK